MTEHKERSYWINKKNGGSKIGNCRTKERYLPNKRKKKTLRQYRITERKKEKNGERKKEGH